MTPGVRFGMGSDAGEAALAIVVRRLRGADLATVAGELPGAIALIASVYPEVRSELVAQTIADALDLRG
jgi:hypothetical protein